VVVLVGIWLTLIVGVGCFGIELSLCRYVADGVVVDGRLYAWDY